MRIHLILRFFGNFEKTAVYCSCETRVFRRVVESAHPSIG